MKDLIRAEFLKIRTTRTVYGLLAAMLALVAFGVFTALGNDPDSWRSVPLEDQEFLFLCGSIMWLFVLILALRSFTDEFRQGTIVPTLLTNPDRRRVLLAKVVAVAATSVVFMATACALALAIGLPRLASQGADANVTTAVLAILLGKFALMSMLWAALGVGLGLAVRHQVGAIVGSLVWIMFVEMLLENWARAVAKYLPVHSTTALIGPPGASDVVLGALAGGLMLAVWAAAALGTGVFLMHRRDIA